MTNLRLDLNCDMGECVDRERLTLEERIMPLVTSVSIACGFHAGDQDLMRRTVRLARAHGVAVGAHPSFRDVEGFGRREMKLSPTEAENLVTYQVGALAGVAALEGVRLSHVKPHGALYNMAARDRGLADVIARAVATIDRRLILYGLSGSALIEAGREMGLTVADEAFVDRAYRPDGSLVSRGSDGAIIQDQSAVIERVRRLVSDGIVLSQNGSLLPIRADTICLHADTPGSLRLAEGVRQELVRLRVSLQAMAHAGI